MIAQSLFSHILHRPAGLVGLIVIILYVLVAILAPFVAPFDPVKQTRGKELAAPGDSFLVGTDQYGRDIFSRLIFGSRISLTVALISVVVGGGLGILTGLLSGYYGGWVDSVVMRIFDVILAYPALILSIAIVAVIGTGWINVAYALSIVYVPQFARIVRASVLTQKELEYVSAAASLGCTESRIMFRQILPNCIGPILVQSSLSFGHAVLAESSLSFLGLGTQPPFPSWGTMISEGQTYLRQAWWYPVFPGLALAFLSISLNFLSDTIRDAFDPSRRSLKE